MGYDVFIRRFCFNKGCCSNFKNIWKKIIKFRFL